MPENEDSDVTKQTVKMLYAEVKSRVMQLANNDANLLRKIFNDFDLNGT